jgi:hypothetical protein
MVMTKTRPDPPADAEDFPTINRRMTGFLDGIRKRKTALSLAANYADADAERAAWARTFAADFVEIAKRRPDKLIAEIRDLEDEAESLEPFLLAAREKHEQLQAQQATAIARELQPKQKQIVKRISGALESLSAALGDARDLHREFDRRSPRPTSPFWANTAGELMGLANLADYRSAGAVWAQRMRSLGLLPK